jgi:hypothetical protein
MDQELFERVSRRCVGHEDDPVALTKGEVRQLLDEFNKDRDGLGAVLNDRNFDRMGDRERIRSLEEANDLLRHNRERAHAEILRLRLEVDRWQKEAATWKMLHDQNLEMQKVFERAKLPAIDEKSFAEHQLRLPPEERQ